MHPIVAIVGRMNVGKSRLFNRIVGGRTAIVADMPGVTRDRHYALADWCGHEFIMVDTGGIEFDPASDLERCVTNQSLKAIEEADVIVAVFDGEMGLHTDDEVLVRKLRKLDRPLIVVVNKIDVASREPFLTSFHRLGVNPIAVSAEHGRGVDELLEAIVSLSLRGDPPKAGRRGNLLQTSDERRSPRPDGARDDSPEGTRVAIIGRPNVGKSTLINRLAGSERVVAHETPGTTRDAIDVEIDVGDKRYIFVDTAGIRRHHRQGTVVEKVTTIKSLKTIEHADVVCLLIDGPEKMTHQDAHLAAYVCERGKGLLVAVNKWDLVKGPWKEYEEDVQESLGDMGGLVVLKLSAKTGTGCDQLLPTIDQLQKALQATLPTAELNRVLEQALQEHHLPLYRGKAMRVFYGTQVKKAPPTFLLFVTDPKGFPLSYRRYLAHRLQEALGATTAPAHMVFRKKG